MLTNKMINISHENFYTYCRLFFGEHTCNYLQYHNLMICDTDGVKKRKKRKEKINGKKKKTLNSKLMPYCVHWEICSF